MESKNEQQKELPQSVRALRAYYKLGGIEKDILSAYKSEMVFMQQNIMAGESVRDDEIRIDRLNEGVIRQLSDNGIEVTPKDLELFLDNSDDLD